METKNYKIVLEKPCSEQWEGMAVNEIGRFCDKCEKTVVDFTLLSDEDIIAYFIKNKDKETCGRLYKTQLERIIIPIDTHTFLFAMTAKQRLLLMFLLVFGYDLYRIELAFGQNMPQDSIINQTIDTQKIAVKSTSDTLIVAATDTVRQDTAAAYVWQSGDTSMLKALVEHLNMYTTYTSCISGGMGMQTMGAVGMDIPQTSIALDYGKYYTLATMPTDLVAENADSIPKQPKKPKKTNKNEEKQALLPERLVVTKKEE